MTRARRSRPANGLVSAGRRALTRPGGVIGLVLLGSMVALAVAGPMISPGNPLAIKYPPMLAPSRHHLFGTDNLGRDEFRAVAHGLRTSLRIVVGTTVLSALLGTVFGVLAGYYGGGLVDRAFLRFSEILQTIPRIFLVILAITLFGSGERNLIVVLAITSWVFLARVTRSEALSVRNRGYVEAAKASGSGDARVIARHVAPNVMPVAIVVIALNASGVILVEAGLAYLGLASSTHVTLGSLLNTAQVFLSQAWWMSVFPGAAIAITVLGINLIGDAFGDAFRLSGTSAKWRHGTANPGTPASS
ncbi:MAG TPA: ABC transporter permease [Acidimicrobiales bacterium]|nr:ABC transporter permease [Acidimicrobiales bacterium]